MDKRIDYRSPTLSDLKKHRIVPVYLDYQNQEKLQGYAMILERIPLTKNTYIRKEIGSALKRDPNCIVWKYDKFRIRYVDPWLYDSDMPQEERFKYIHQKDFTTIHKIAYFHTINSVIHENI